MSLARGVNPTDIVYGFKKQSVSRKKPTPDPSKEGNLTLLAMLFSHLKARE